MNDKLGVGKRCSIAACTRRGGIKLDDLTDIREAWHVYNELVGMGTTGLEKDLPIQEIQQANQLIGSTSAQLAGAAAPWLSSCRGCPEALFGQDMLLHSADR